MGSLQPRIIAMWSGPRNISTALMRSWSSRADTAVIDEPFYAHYLQATGYDHPGAAETLAAYESDWRRVIAERVLAGGQGRAIYYQKQMTHHMLAHIDRAWMQAATNCFLIRDPRRMILSFAKVIPDPKPDQMGLTQQLELFRYVCETSGEVPVVIDARDILLDPERALRGLCGRLGLPFDRAMLRWPAGRQPSDGIWGKYWYGNLEKTTAFMPYRADDSPVPAHLQALLDECQPLYDQMAQHRLRL